MPALIRTAGEYDSVTKNVKLDYPDGLDSTGVTNILKYTGIKTTPVPKCYIIVDTQMALFVVFKILMMQPCFFNTLTNAIPPLSLEWKQKQMANCLF